MTLCNYCTLERIKAEAPKGWVVTVRPREHPDAPDLVDVYVHKPDEAPNDSINGGNFAGSFLELPEECAC